MRKVFFTVAMMAAGLVMAQDPGFFLDDWQEKSAELPESIIKEKSTAEATVEIHVDASDLIARVPMYIYGNNAVTWGGNMNQHATIMKDISNLDPHVLRWPGGNLSQDYFWNLSSDQRPDDIPADVNAQYGMNVENWRMSTPQYYQLLESTRSTGSVCVNYSYARYGTGPNPVAKAAHLAAEWVRYDNGRSKYWEIGNENFGSWERGYKIDVTKNQDGQPEYINGQLYGQHCKVFIDSMRKAADDIGVEIKIGVVAYDAETSYDPISQIWNEGMMPEVGDLADFLIVHSYFTPHDQDSPASVILNSHDVPSHIMSDIKADMEEAGKPMIPVALTEWNIFAVRSMQQVSYINGMHAALVLGELVINDYGMATRWDLTNGWSDGDDHGMFSRAGEPGVDLYNPRPVFFYMFYFQKYFGDRMISSVVSGNDEIISYASTFSSGETGMVLINKGSSHETAAISLENLDQGSWYHTMTLTGGDDNGEFSRKVFLNGVGGDEEGGGPDDYEAVKAFASKTRGGIQVDLPPYSVVYLMAEKPGPFSYISSRVEDDAEVIHLELSEDVQELSDPAGFTLLLADGTEVEVLDVVQDTLALYQVNLKLDRALKNSDTLTLSYDGSGILSTKDEPLSPFSNESVINALPGDPFSISFHTECNQTGASLEGCLVRFNGEEGTSDENGMAQFLAQPGDYLVGVEKEHLETITDMALSIHSDSLITLSLDSSSYVVVLQISDNLTGALLSGVSVSCASQDDVNSSDGMVRFALFAGERSFGLEKFNYSPGIASAEIVSDTLLKVKMTRTHARAKFRLRNGVQPVNKASVEINGESIVSNQLGQSVFPSIPVSVSLDYKVQREGYETIEGSVELQADSTIELQMILITSVVNGPMGSDELFRVYPNPATERIFIESREGDITGIELLDLSGRSIRVHRPESAAFSLELTDVAPGIYVLKAETANASHSERIVISP